MQRRISRSLIILTTLAVILCIYWAKPILVPLAFAIFFSLLLMPLVDLLSKWLPRLAAAAATALLAIGVLGGLAFAVGKQFAVLAESLPTTMQHLLERVHSFTPSNAAFAPIRSGMESVLKQLSALPAEGTAPAHAIGAKDAMDIVATFVNPLASMGIICIMVLFILWDRDVLIERIVRALGRGELNVTTQALSDVRSRISRFLSAQLLSNTFFATATCLGLLVLGIPNILAWCLVTVFLRFIPYVGILIAASVPLLLAAGMGGWEVLYVALLYICAEVLLVSLIEPIWFGQSAGISALALVFSAIFWTSLWGLPGLFLSTPLTVCLLMIGKHVPQLSFLNTLLSSEPVIDPAARLYQRWLTLETKDAAAFVGKELESKPLLEVCDRALIPALRMAEVDRHKGRLSQERTAKLDACLLELEQNWPVYLDKTDLSEWRKKYSLSNYDRQFLKPHSVICVAASDQADQVSSSLFHNILMSLHLPSTELSKEILVGEAVEKILQSPADIVVISSVPPRAILPARYLVKRLKSRNCQKRILIGLWGDVPKRSATWRSEELGVNEQVAFTIEEGLRIVHQWSAGLSAENRSAEPVLPSKPLVLAEIVARPARI